MSGNPSNDTPNISPDELYTEPSPTSESGTPAPAPEPAGRDAVVHTTDSAGNSIDVHYDEDGNVVLVEADTDGDGRVDAAAN